MKKYRALIGVILRFLTIIAMWAWWLNIPSDTGGYDFVGALLIFLLMLAYTTALFVGAILRLSDYFLLRKWERGNITEFTLKVKTHKSPVSLSVQSLVVVITVWLLFYAVGWQGSLIIIAVFIALKLIDE